MTVLRIELRSREWKPRMLNHYTILPFTALTRDRTGKTLEEPYASITS